jgi:hypothetical protein
MAMDGLFLGGVAVLFAITVGLVYGCEKLNQRGRKQPAGKTKAAR